MTSCPTCRLNAAFDYHPTVGLVIAGGSTEIIFEKTTGGYAPRGVLDKVYRTKDYGVTFEALPKLPNKVYEGCLVIVDEDEIIRIGGKSHVTTVLVR